MPIAPLNILAGTYPSIQPFTTRENPTLIHTVESMRVWITNDLTPYVADNVSRLSNDWVLQVAELDARWTALSIALIEQVNESVAGVDVSAAEAEAARVAAEAARDLAQQYAADAGEQSDAALTDFFNTLTSAFRIAIDATYAAKDIETVIETGRLSVDEMLLYAKTADVDDELALKADLTLVTEIDENLTTLEGEVGDVETSVAVLSNSVVPTALAVKRGGMYPVGLFQGLRDGIVNPALTTRVVVLGDSHAVGGHSKHITQSIYNRLAFRCGSALPVSLTTISQPVVGAGMRWYNGAINGATTQVYYPVGNEVFLNRVAPNFVIHNIGVNDYAQQIPIVDFKSRLRSALERIETANPNVVNIVIHSHGLPKPVNIATPWSEYGIAADDVVKENATHRVYVDVNPVFQLQGMDTGIDRANLMHEDNVHLNENGSLLFANTLGAVMGVPSESDFANTQVFDLPSPISSVISALTTMLGVTIPGASYPRVVSFHGSMYCASNGNAANMILITKQSNNENKRQIAGSMGSSKFAISASFYIAPGAAETFVINALPVGGTMQFDPDPVYNGIQAIVHPA